MAIQSLGSDIDVGFGDWAPDVFENLFCQSDAWRKLDPLGGVAYISTNRSKVVDRDLVVLRECGDLEYLSLMNASITDTTLSYLEDCTNLEVLLVNGRGISGYGLHYLIGNHKLTTLAFANTNVTDTHLSALCSLPSLTNLVLSGTYVSDAGLLHLSRCPKLKLLLLNNSHVSLADVGHGVFEGLETLDVYDAPVENIDPSFPIAFPRITTLSLHHTMLTTQSLRVISSSQRLLNLSIDIQVLDDDTLAIIGDMKSLQTLTLFDRGGGRAKGKRLREIKDALPRVNVRS